MSKLKVIGLSSCSLSRLPPSQRSPSAWFRLGMFRHDRALSRGRIPMVPQATRVKRSPLGTLIVCCAVSLVLFLGLASLGTSQARNNLAPTPMPGTGLRPSDSIDHFDFTVDGDRSIDVTWLATIRDGPNDSYNAKTQLWCRRLDLAT